MRPVVYVHVPKAAGTTLKDILQRVYAGSPMLFFTPRGGELERLRRLPASARSRVAVLAGHAPFGYQDVFRGCGVEPAVITMIREPVARVVSLFRYIHRSPEHPRHEAFVGAGTTIADVYSAAEFTPFDNDQVRFLAGARTRGKPFGGLSREDLELAKRNLAAGCRAFGLQERFGESVVWFARELAWPRTAWTDLNRSPVGEGGPTLAEADRALIAERNALDAELYAFAAPLFDERARTI